MNNQNYQHSYMNQLNSLMEKFRLSKNSFRQSYRDIYITTQTIEINLNPNSKIYLEL